MDIRPPHKLASAGPARATVTALASNPVPPPTRPIPRLVPAIAALVLAFLGATSTHALEPTTALANLNRQGWVMENGLPQNTVQALAQTPDGFLWLGTEVGLVRFDGMNFEVLDEHSKPAIPGSDIRCLLVTADGSLWIGTSNGLARLQNGVLTTFTEANGLPGDEIRALGNGENGTVIALTNNGPVRVTANRQSAMTENLPAGSGPTAGTQFQAQLPNGESAQSDNSTLVLHGGKADQRFSIGRQLPGTRIQALYADREGALWIGTNGGLIRYSQGQLEKLPVTDPLASASVLAILEDHEGNLWVGTESSGLQILRDQRFHTLTTRDGLASDNISTVVQDSTGTLWIGTDGSGVTALRPIAGPTSGVASGIASDSTTAPVPSSGFVASSARTYSVRNGLPSDVILSLAAAPDGTIWLGTPDGLARLRYGGITSFTSADGLPDDFIRSLLIDPDGSLWIGTRRGLTHWGTTGKAPGDPAAPMNTYTTANGLGSDLVGALARDGSGDLWIATFKGLSRMQNGGLVNYTTANGLSSNVITTLLARANGSLLIGTQDHGWSQWDGVRFSPVTGNGLERTTIRAILDDGRGHLWFASGNGIARCDCSSSTSPTAPMQGAGCSHWIEFSTADGLRSRETAVNSHPSAIDSKDGRLWFATPKGLVEVDPAHFPVNTVPPPVAIERFAVDDTDQALQSAGLRVPAGHNHFQFDYAALSFVAPQKVHYRYKLEGFDRNWTDAGPRRIAFYTNIPPGHYTFRVQAANNDGLWNTAGTSLAFTLRPHFYQTIWFYLLLALALIGLVFLALRLRLMRAEREFQAVLGERNRIAREIHDTLAQGYVGISVQLEVLSEFLRQRNLDAADRLLNATRGFVREGLNDARQSIWALRSQDSNETTLPARLSRITEEAGSRDLHARFSLYGAYRPLPPSTENEIVRVAQEAIHNVKKHAGARSVNVQLDYLPSEIALEVRDDGHGFESDRAAGQSTGHYGLTGMRERAEAISGTLEVVSKPGVGVTVHLRAPAPRGAAQPSAPGGAAKEEKEQV